MHLKFYWSLSKVDTSLKLVDMARHLDLALVRRARSTIWASREETDYLWTLKIIYLEAYQKCTMHWIVGERTFDVIVLHHKKEFSSKCIWGGILSSSLCCWWMQTSSIPWQKRQVPVFNFSFKELPYGHRSGISLGSYFAVRTCLFIKRLE